VDVMRVASGQDAAAFGAVFLAEAALFVLAALMAMRVIEHRQGRNAIIVPGE